MLCFMVRKAKFSSFNCLTCMGGEPDIDVCKRKGHIHEELMMGLGFCLGAERQKEEAADKHSNF